MSPSEPPIRISDASASRYAFETHCCAERPPPRSRSIAGKATLTIVPSIVATPEPRIAARSVSRCRCVTRPRYASDASASALHERVVENLVEPAIDRRGDLLPVGRDHVQVRTALEFKSA